MNTSTAPVIMNSSVSTKATKKVSKKTDEVSAPAAPAVPAAPAAPAVTAAPAVAAPEAKRSKKAAAPAVAPVVVAPVVVVTPADVTVVASPVEGAVAPVVSVQDDVRSMLLQANTVRESVCALVAELKRLEKRVARLQKDADKRRRRGKKVLAEGEVAPPRKPSIFELPTPLSNDLCAFLNVANGSKESRSNVTKAITTYVKENNLKNKHNITPDQKLTFLLGVKDGEPLTYFNLQRYLNRHYLKAAVAPVVTA